MCNESGATSSYRGERYMLQLFQLLHVCQNILTIKKKQDPFHYLWVCDVDGQSLFVNK